MVTERVLRLQKRQQELVERGRRRLARSRREIVRRPTTAIAFREQKERQRRLVEERKRITEEKKRVAQQIEQARKATLQQQVKIGGVTFTQGELQNARSYGRLVALGKPTFGEPGKKAFDKLSGASKDFKREIQAGIGARIEAKRLGFRSVEEFASLQKREQKAVAAKIAAKPLSEKLELQRKSVEIRSKELAQIKQLTPQQKKQFFKDQIEFKKAAKFQQLKEEGKKLTTEARRFLDKATLKLESQFIARQKEFGRKVDILARKIKAETIEREKKKVIPKFKPKNLLINVLNNKVLSIKQKQEKIAKIKNLPSNTLEIIKNKIPEGSFERFVRGFQKVAVSKRFRSEEIKKEQDKKIKDFRKRLEKNKGEIDLTDEIARSFEDKDIATFSKVSGAAAGVFNPFLGAAVWSVGDIGERAEKLRKEKKGVKVTKGELGRLAVTSATKGAILGFLMKAGGHGLDIAGKKILTKVATKKIENTAMKSAVNHGGQLLKVTGKGGKNVITTYFYKDIAGNLFEVTADVKRGRFNNAIRKTTETGGAAAGFIGGAKLGSGAVKGALVTTGRFKPTIPEKVTKRIPADVMARQLLKKGKIVLTRRGVYETGKGLVPRKDAWLDPDVKVPTKGVFWRFDKTLDKKGDAISPLPLFTKDKSKYWNMFNQNWKKNKGMGLVKRYIKTTAETPVVDDILIRNVIDIKDMKDKKLRDLIIKEFATKGKLSKSTQNKVLKQKLPLSDKNRERGFHDENEFVTRKVTKLKNKKDLSWTFDPVLQEYIPVIQNLKDGGRIKNFLTVLKKKKIITKTDAQFIKDNYAIKKKFKERAILPKGHSFEHMKNVERNIVKLMDKYPEFNKHWKKKYGSISNAKKQLKNAMWHDIGKTSESSIEFGTPHGQKVWNVWKAGLLPKGIKLNKASAKAIRVHENLDPRKIRYKIRNRIGKITPEEKIVATADRLDLARYNIKIDEKRLPLKDAIKKLKLDVKVKKYPKNFNTIINKIKNGQKVSKKDIKKITSWKPKKVKKIPKRKIFKARRKIKVPPRKRPKPTREKVRPKPKERPRIRGRPSPRPSPRPKPRPPGRPPKRPPKRPPTRPPGRPPTEPPIGPPGRPPTGPPKIRIKRKKKIVKKKKIQAYRVKARPLKKKGQKKRPKLIKVSKVPLIKRNAKDLRNYISDTSLARTAKIEKTKGKPKKPVRKVPRNYAKRTAKKFRSHRIVKGKRRPLSKGTVIERKTRLLDTKQERKKITLRQRMRQITPKKSKVRVKKAVRRPQTKVIKRKSVQRITKPIRRVTKKPVKRIVTKPFTRRVIKPAKRKTIKSKKSTKKVSKKKR